MKQVNITKLKNLISNFEVNNEASENSQIDQK